jgi:rhamnosyl/mannosyltransferase
VKVLQVYKDYAPVVGGIESHLERLAVDLARRGVEIEVLVTARGKETVRTREAAVAVTRAGRLATFASTPLSVSLFREIGGRRPDIVHLHHPYPIGELAWLLRSPAPAVISYHSDIVRQRQLLRVYRPFLRRVLARARFILVNDLRYAESSPHLGRHLAKCRPVPWGIEVERYGPRPDLAPRAAELRRTLGTPLVLFIGQLRYYKGVQFLLEAMRRTDGHLAVIGDGPERARLEEVGRSKDLAGRVHLLGRLSDEDVIAAYHACDVFVLPSVYRSEAWGFVILEAMAAGKPVITTELGTGTSILNRQGETGLVVPPADPEALARAIDALLGDPAAREAMGRKGYERVSRNFTHARTVARTLAVYREVLGE